MTGCSQQLATAITLTHPVFLCARASSVSSAAIITLAGLTPHPQLQTRLSACLMTGAVHVHEHRVMKKVYGPLRLSPAAMLQASTCMLGIVVLAALLVNKGNVKLPMPYPAHDHYFHQWPKEAPFNPRTPDASMLNSILQQYAVRLFEGQLVNVETVTVDPRDGRLLLPDKWGDIHEARQLSDGSYVLNPRPIAQLGPGRVLGSKLDAEGNLVMCDVLKGLLRFNTTSRQLEHLASKVSNSSRESPNSPIFYANGLDIASNGSIYFTSSTDILPARAQDGSYDTGFAWVLNNFRALPLGRVLVYHPYTRETHVVASGFYYSDGVALSDDGKYLLVVETDALRVVKVWLEGEKAGTKEILVDSLPGLPAGLSKAEDGNFWVSMTVPVPPYSKYLGPVLLRALIAWCPRSWRPPVKVWGAVLKLSPQGEILQLLLDPDGSRVATASAATEHKGRLFLGSIMGGPFISYIDLAVVDQHFANNSNTTAGHTQAASASMGALSWNRIGGYSLHEQKDLWGHKAAGRVRRL